MVFRSCFVVFCGRQEGTVCLISMKTLAAPQERAVQLQAGSKEVEGGLDRNGDWGQRVESDPLQNHPVLVCFMFKALFLLPMDVVATPC